MLNMAHPAPSARQASERNSKSSTGFAQPFFTLFWGGGARELDRYPSFPTSWNGYRSNQRLAREAQEEGERWLGTPSGSTSRRSGSTPTARPGGATSSFSNGPGRVPEAAGVNRPGDHRVVYEPTGPWLRSLRVGCGRISTSRRSVPRREMRKEMSCESWSRCRISRRSMHSSGARAEFLAIASHELRATRLDQGIDRNRHRCRAGPAPGRVAPVLPHHRRAGRPRAEVPMRCLISNLPVSPEDAGGGAASPRAAPPRPLPPGLLRSPAAAPTRDPSPSGCTPSAPLPDDVVQRSLYP